MPINGTAGNDTLLGTAFDDEIFGFDGDDYLDGMIGADMLFGGLGNDSYLVNSTDDLIIEEAGEGTDMVYAQVDWSLEGSEVENLILTGAGLTGSGNAYDNVIFGMDGDNYIWGNEGNDTLFGGAGRDRLYGGVGNDTLYGEAGGDVLSGGTGIDTANYSREGAGVTVSLAVTTIQNTGGSGWDRLSGIENLIGSDYDDHLTGGLGANVLDGGLGNDWLDGGAGRDTVSYHRFGANIWVDLAITEAQDTNGAGWDTLVGIENLDGTGYEDNFAGNAVANRLFGDCGNDILDGRGGNDTIIGGQGADLLTGGTGADRFVFTLADYSPTIDTSDTVTDFRATQKDKIDVSGFDANATLDGLQHFAFIGNALFTHQAGELRYEVGNGETWLYGDIDGDGGADFTVRFEREFEFAATDFIL